MKKNKSGAIIRMAASISAAVSLAGCAVSTSTERAGYSTSSHQVEQFRAQTRVESLRVKRRGSGTVSFGPSEQHKARAEHRRLVNSLRITRASQWSPHATDQRHRELVAYRKLIVAARIK